MEQRNTGNKVHVSLTSKRSVSMKPGEKQLTRSRGPSSRASALVNPSIAPLIEASGEQLSPGRRLSTPDQWIGTIKVIMTRAGQH